MSTIEDSFWNNLEIVLDRLDIIREMCKDLESKEIQVQDGNKLAFIAAHLAEIINDYGIKK